MIMVIDLTDNGQLNQEWIMVNVTSNSPSQDYTHPDDHNLPNYDKSFRWIGRISERSQISPQSISRPALQR